MVKTVILTEDDSEDVKEYSERVNDVYSQYKLRTVKLKFSKPHTCSPIHHFPAIISMRSHTFVTHLSSVCDTVDLHFYTFIPTFTLVIVDTTAAPALYIVGQ